MIDQVEIEFNLRGTFPKCVGLGEEPHSEVIESETDIDIVITLDYISSNNPQ